MDLIDSHCHLDLPAFDDDRQQVVQRARTAGVSAMVIPAIRRSGWRRLAQVCEDHTDCHAAYGLHPVFLEHHKPEDIAALDRWLDDNPAVAVGECGLDFHETALDPERQRQIFIDQLEVAGNHRLPVIIHARKAVEAVLLIVRKFPEIRGVLHSFSGSLNQARLLIDRGFVLGFGGPVTNPGAHRLHRLIPELPLEGIVIESDSPDQPDAQWRGRRNEPCRITVILQQLARLRQESPEALAAATTANARALFELREAG